MKPFIHLFKSINSCYFYDVNRNEIISISEESYQILERTMKDLELLGNENLEIRRLFEYGYLKDTKVEKIEHSETKNVQYYLDRKLGHLILQVTQGCNLKCGYCTFASDNYKFFRPHSNKKMTWEIAKKALDYYFKHSIDSDEYRISFYGGEPLLAFDLIVKIVKYIKIEYPYHLVAFSMATNGTLLTDEKIDFFIENEFELTLSIDGAKKIHDFNRKFLSDGTGSYNVIIENLKNIRKKDYNFYKKISFNAVVDPINSYLEIKNGMRNDPILKELSGQANLIDDRGAMNKLVIPEKFDIEYEYSMFLVFLERFNIVIFTEKQEVLSNEFLNYDQMKSFMIPTDKLAEIGVPSGVCLPGKQKWFVRYDGQCYPCEKVSELSDYVNIGNIEEGLLVDKVKSLVNISENSENRCKECWAFRLCDHCAAAYDNGGHISKILNAEKCIATLNNIELSMLEMILEREVERFY